MSIEADDTSVLIVDDLMPGVKRITLNRPKVLNAFSYDMYAALIDSLRSFRHDLSVRVIVLTGAGKGFCAGHDLRNAGTAPWADPELGRMYSARISLEELGQIPLLMKALPQPIIAAVNGAAAGVGYSIAMAADLCIAASSAKFVNSTHNAATGSELGLSYLLPRAVGSQRAAELLLTARPVHADEAERIGLVLRTVPDDSLMDSVRELAGSILENVPLGIWLTKQSFWRNLGAGSFEQALDYESRAVPIAQATEDAAEKRASFIERRKPTFRYK